MYNTFQISGTIRYYNNWVLAWIDKDFGKYYRSLLPKAWYIKPPANHSHVSIVRHFEGPANLMWGEYEKPYRDNWDKYEGQSIVIDYVPGIKTDGTYYWIDCYSDEIGYVRRSLGLDTFRKYQCYHITIGNVKEQDG